MSLSNGKVMLVTVALVTRSSVAIQTKAGTFRGIAPKPAFTDLDLKKQRKGNWGYLREKAAGLTSSIRNGWKFTNWPEHSNMRKKEEDQLNVQDKDLKIHVRTTSDFSDFSKADTEVSSISDLSSQSSGRSPAPSPTTVSVSPVAFDLDGQKASFEKRLRNLVQSTNQSNDETYTLNIQEFLQQLPEELKAKFLEFSPEGDLNILSDFKKEIMDLSEHSDVHLVESQMILLVFYQRFSANDMMDILKEKDMDEESALEYFDEMIQRVHSVFFSFPGQTKEVHFSEQLEQLQKVLALLRVQEHDSHVEKAVEKYDEELKLAEKQLGAFDFQNVDESQSGVLQQLWANFFGALDSKKVVLLDAINYLSENQEMLMAIHCDYPEQYDFGSFVDPYVQELLALATYRQDKGTFKYENELSMLEQRKNQFLEDAHTKMSPKPSFKDFKNRLGEFVKEQKNILEQNLESLEQFEKDVDAIKEVVPHVSAKLSYTVSYFNELLVKQQKNLIEEFTKHASTQVYDDLYYKYNPNLKMPTFDGFHADVAAWDNHKYFENKRQSFKKQAESQTPVEAGWTTLEFHKRMKDYTAELFKFLDEHEKLISSVDDSSLALAKYNKSSTLLDQRKTEFMQNTLRFLQDFKAQLEAAKTAEDLGENNHGQAEQITEAEKGRLMLQVEQHINKKQEDLIAQYDYLSAKFEN